MPTLESQFASELIKQCEKAQEVCPDYRPTRFLQNIQRFGALKAVKELLRRGQPSDGFAILADAKRLDLSMEALVIKGRYGGLFSDAEVNGCFQLLCDQGYFG